MAFKTTNEITAREYMWEETGEILGHIKFQSLRGRQGHLMGGIKAKEILRECETLL